MASKTVARTAGNYAQCGACSYQSATNFVDGSVASYSYDSIVVLGGILAGKFGGVSAILRGDYAEIIEVAVYKTLYNRNDRYAWDS